METNVLSGRLAIFRINYKSDFIITLNSDAGWMTPFCIKFWTGAPSQAYFAGWDGTTYTNCAPVQGDPTKLEVQFDDHHLPIGELKYQIGYHFTVADFPTTVEDEVLNQERVVISHDGQDEKVLLDFNGETAPDIQFSLPAYANEAQRIANEEQRIAHEAIRIVNEEGRIAAEQTRQQNEEQRIQHEEDRVSEFARLKSESEAATIDATAAATLANTKAQLAADKAALAQSAADLANAKAHLAADKAALAASAAQLANDKAALAQQKAEYAQTQGTYAKNQGDYAKQQGDYAKDQGDTALADHLRAEADHETAASDHTRAESDHSTASSDHTQAGNDHTRAESDHSTATSDHTTAGNDHTRAESDHSTAASDHTTAGNDHTRAESDHTRAESDHAAVEVYVDSLGVFDLSKHNAVGGVLATYADLSAALTALNALESKYKYGGMSFKFVQSSDNKYVQFRCMSDEFTTDTTQWAIYSDTILIENEEYIGAYTDIDGRFLVGIRRADGHVIYGAGVPPQIVEYINNKIAELHLDKVDDIITFIGNLLDSDKTLQMLLNEKVDKEDGKELMSSDLAGSLSMVEEPEYMDAETDSDGKVLAGRKADGTKFENMPQETPTARFESIEDAEGRLDVYKDADGKVISYRDKDGILHEYGIKAKQADFKNVNVEDMHFVGDIPQQIKDYVQAYVPEDKQDEIPYNDLLSVGNRVIKTYNPYKEQKQHQYTGQMHFHSWTKYADTDYPSGYPSEKWKVPYGYSIAAIPAGETNTEKYLWGMPHEKLVAILNALAMAYIWRHKKLGYNFVALSDYARFEDVTHKPNLSDITYLQTEYPDAYAYFADLYLDGFDVNDFDADGNLKDFCWLCDSYETTTLTLDVSQHMIVHGAGNTSEPYGSGTFNDVMKRVEDKGCIVQWPHPTDADTFATHPVMDTVPKRLRLMEIYDGVSVRKYAPNGTMTNREYIPAGVMLDEPYDYMLSKGNFIFGMAISDERPAYGRTGEAMFIINPALNLKNGCIKVFCDGLNSAEIFGSILNGNFYASSSSDASINSVSIENGQYTVDVGVEGVVVEFVKEDNTIVKTVTTSAGNTTASYDIDGSEKFVRARIYKLNALPYDANYWYKNKEWMIWTQPLLISNTIL